MLFFCIYQCRVCMCVFLCLYCFCTIPQHFNMSVVAWKVVSVVHHVANSFNATAATLFLYSDLVCLTYIFIVCPCTQIQVQFEEKHIYSNSSQDKLKQWTCHSNSAFSIGAKKVELAQLLSHQLLKPGFPSPTSLTTNSVS